MQLFKFIEKRINEKAYFENNLNFIHRRKIRQIQIIGYTSIQVIEIQRTISIIFVFVALSYATARLSYGWLVRLSVCPRVISATINGFIVCIVCQIYSKSITTVGRHYVSNYFYCRIHPEGLLYDAARDLLAIAKFLVYLLHISHTRQAARHNCYRFTQRYSCRKNYRVDDKLHRKCFQL